MVWQGVSRSKTYGIAYKKAQNSYYYLLNSKKYTIRKKISECSTDSRKLHKLINNLTKPQEEQQWPKHNNPEVLANEFATYFEDKILKIRKVLETTPPYWSEQSNAHVLSRLVPLAEKEVEKSINSLKTKSCKIDTIPTDILKQLAPVILPLITKIVNLSLMQGEFCRSWKTATVRPLLKKLGLALIHSNYRPVSNLTFISKIIERCMLLQTSDHCEKYNLQPDYQSAYIANYSMRLASYMQATIFYGQWRNRASLHFVAMDLSTAFNTVEHEILLTILSTKFGIEGRASKWFDTYLHPRSYKAVINGHYSSEVNLNISIPQGSCASANIYIIQERTIEIAYHIS